MNKKRFWQLTVLLFLLIFLLIFWITPDSLKRLFLGSRAYINQLNLKIQLQGEYEKIAEPVFKTKVVFYNQNGAVKQFADLLAKKETKNIFKIEIDIGGLNLNDRYALFIKPEKFLGRLFCSVTVSGAACTTPQLILNPGENNLDLSQQPFLSGDIEPADGKITAQDISKIFSQIGKTASDSASLAADINSDQKVEAVDYSLALYSLSKNAVDDAITFTTASTTPTSSGNQPTVSPTTAPTAVPSPTLSSPNITGAGTCQTTISGKLYIRYQVALMSGEQCTPLNNETSHYCVNSQSECSSTNCLEKFIQTIKAELPRYASACGATLTLDEAKTKPTLSCQTNFVPGNCTPMPTPTVSCNSSGASC